MDEEQKGKIHCVLIGDGRMMDRNKLYVECVLGSIVVLFAQPEYGIHSEWVLTSKGLSVSPRYNGKTVGVSVDSPELNYSLFIIA